MQKEVQKFFIDLEQKRVNKENNIIQLNSDRITRVRGHNGLARYNVDGTYALIKYEALANIIYGAASSKMYNDLGIPTPRTCPIQLSAPDNSIFIASQDVRPLASSKLDVVIAQQTALYKDNLLLNWKKPTTLSKWQIIKQKKTQSLLLKYMTKECLEQLINILIVDELRTDPDRHWGNFFFYKTHNSEKWQGVIPIDLEFIQLLESGGINAEKDFEKFLNTEYSAYTPLEIKDSFKNYKKRMQAMQEFLYQGNFSQKQVELIKKELEYDFPELIKHLGKKYSLLTKTKSAYNMTARLWEYNRAHIGRDLGL